MSSRSTRARGRISYAETRSDDSDASESDGASEEEWNVKKKAKKAQHKSRAPQGNKNKAKRGRDSTDDASSSGESDVDDDDGAHDDDEGVNFIHVVPYEIVAEIFSYLSPRELLYFSNLSKSFHAILSGPSSASLWSKARKNLDIPAVEYGSITELQLATLLFDKTCELCGTGVVKTPDVTLRKRYCLPCRQANWVRIDDVGKLYPDIHPASIKAVAHARFTPNNTRYESSSRYALLTELQAASDHMEYLELLDEAGQVPGDTDDEEAQSLGGDEQAGGGGAVEIAVKRSSGRRSTRGRINYAVDGLSTAETHRQIKLANRLKNWGNRDDRGTQIESEVFESFSPSVQTYVKAHQRLHEAWAEVAAKLEPVLQTIESTLDSEFKDVKATTRRIVQTRRVTIESKLMKKGFKHTHFSDAVWTSNDLVNLPKALTDEEWRKIKKRLIKLAGNSLANQIYNSAVAATQRVADKKNAQRKLAQLEASSEKDHDIEDEKEGEIQEMESEDECDESESIAWKKKAFKKPRTLSQKVWKYVLPHLERLVVSVSDLDSASAKLELAKSRNTRFGRDEEDKDPLALLSPQERQVKLDFFAKKYRKLVDMQTSIAQRFSLPVFSRFLHLAVVKELYFDIPMFASRSDVASEKAKSDAIWSKKLDEILEQVDDYAVDTVVHAVETILLATTVTTEEEIARLDIVNLLSDGEKQNHRDDHLSLDADFFALPSSWLICGFCRSFLGPLDTVLKHQHESHSSPQAPSTASLADLHPLELSVQAACAVSAVFEVARVSLDDLTATGDLENALQGKMLVWSNLPTKAGKKSTKAEEWQTLVCRIHRVAVLYELDNQTLAAPTLELRGKTALERHREAWKDLDIYGSW
ncbi:hypothetical protein JCM11491_000717 [Sporobolomyces phaffii]